MQAVAVYVKLKLNEQLEKLSPEIMPFACCWKSQPYLEIADINIFLNGYILLNGN